MPESLEKGNSMNNYETRASKNRSYSTKEDYATRNRTEKAREVAEEVRKSRGTFDRDKFDKFVDNSPLLSGLRLLSDADE